MFNVYAFAALLSIILLLEFKWRFLAPIMTAEPKDAGDQAKLDDYGSPAVDAGLPGIVTRSAAMPSGSDEGEYRDILSSIMSKLAEDDGIENIFAEAENASTVANAPQSVAQRSEKNGPGGESWTIDVAQWMDDPTLAPKVIVEFDTDRDCVVICGPHFKSADLMMKMTRHGIPVLCLGELTVASFPAMTGSNSIDIVVVNDVAA